MAQYDITVILKDKSQVTAVSKLIEAQGGKVIASREIGERQFAYPIGKLTAGYYASFLFELEGAKLTAAQQAITGSDDIIRALIQHYRPSKPLPVGPVKEAPETLPQIKPEPVKEIELKPEPEPELAVAKPEPVKKAIKPAQKKPVKVAKQPSEAERLKALDEQLKKLLEE